MKDIKNLKLGDTIIVCERTNRGIFETITKINRIYHGTSLSVSGGYGGFKVIYENKEEALRATEERYCYMPTSEDIVRINREQLKDACKEDMLEIDKYISSIKELIEEIDELRKDMIWHKNKLSG